MVDKTLALFVRFVALSDEIPDLANQCKALTWEHLAEHAVLGLIDGRRVLVRGGRYGIDLKFAGPDNPFGRPAASLWPQIEDDDFQVNSLVLHTHPKVTGPSDSDLEILRLLKQDQSLLFEIGGSIEGTIFLPKKSR